MEKRGHLGFIYLTSTCLGLSSLASVEGMDYGLLRQSSLQKLTLRVELRPRVISSNGINPNPSILVIVFRSVGPLHYVTHAPAPNMGMWGSVEFHMN